MNIIVTPRLETKLGYTEIDIANRRYLVETYVVEELNRKYLNDFEEIKYVKIKELSKECQANITSGLDIQLSDGQTYHFSYNIEDQSNISEMFLAVLSGAENYPYHADKEDCEIYSAVDIANIYLKLNMYKTSQITYLNQLKRMINDLGESDINMDVIDSITYGDLLTGKYLDRYNELMDLAQKEVENVIKKVQMFNE